MPGLDFGPLRGAWSAGVFNVPAIRPMDLWDGPMETGPFLQPWNSQSTQILMDLFGEHDDDMFIETSDFTAL